jgi:hypothetical protein
LSNVVPERKKYKPNMKKILFLTGIIALLSTTGCIVADGGRRDHVYYDRRPAVVVGVPEVVVRPAPVVIVP